MIDGAKMRGLRGGGCFPISPELATSTDPAHCLKETDSTGQLYTVPKRRESWTVRYMYIEGDGTERLLKDSNTFWTTLSNGATCMEPAIYGCSLTGVSVNEVDWTSGGQISCSLPVGADYRVRLYYQYSRYKPGEAVPPGADEWLPVTQPATATTLSKPGYLVWEQHWTIKPGENALRVSVTPSRINPAVPQRSISKVDTTITNVGGAKTTAIAAGEADIVVTSSECGEPYPNVSFQVDLEHVAQSGGHIHDVSNKVDAPKDAVIKGPLLYQGTTDADGVWKKTLTAGEFAGSYRVSATSADLLGEPVEAKTVVLRVGFVGFQPLSNVAQGAAIIPVGFTNDVGCGAAKQCDNHAFSSQFGHPYLLRFIEAMAYFYTTEVDPDAVLPINDMSLAGGGAFEIPGNWDTYSSHISHRHGVDVDVNAWIKVEANPYVDAGIYKLNPDDLDNIVQDVLDGVKIIEGPLHYRLPGELIDEIAEEIK